jgi:starvation-inducible DNA-binding protein
MKIQIGLTDKGRQGSVDILNALLADEFVLYAKTRNYHWNVTGPDFSELHKFFEAQYEELETIMDDVAERSRSLGGNATATLKEYTTLTRLDEFPNDYPGAKKMLANLVSDHEAIVRILRNDLETCANKLGDMGTSDFLTGLMERHEKMAWMLRSYLERF